MKQLNYYGRIVILFVCATFSNVHADVSHLIYTTEDGASYHRIVIHDEIKLGDYDEFINTVSEIWRQTDSSEYRALGSFDVLLNSIGGDVFEAMRIGNAVRDMVLTVSVPSAVLFSNWDLERGFFREPAIETGVAGYFRQKSLEHPVRCYSACFFIYVAAVNRVFDYYHIAYDDPKYKGIDKEWIDRANEEDSSKISPVGIHRPYFDKSYFSGLTSREARNRYNELEQVVRSYLINMGLGEQWIGKMFSVSSTQLMRLSFGDLMSIGRTEPSWEEWLISNCGYALHTEALSASNVDGVKCLLERVSEERARLIDAYLNHGAQK